MSRCRSSRYQTLTARILAINATNVGQTVDPGRDGLPDLSRLSLGGDHNPSGQSPGVVQAPNHVIPSTNVQISVQTNGAPVTINVFHGAQPGDSGLTEAEGVRGSRVLRSPVGVGLPLSTRGRFLTPSPAQQNTGANGPAATAATAPAVAVATVPVGGSDTAGAAALGAPAGEPTGPVASTSQVTQEPSFEDCKLVLSHYLSSALTLPVDEDIAPPDPTHTRWYVVTAGRRVGIFRDWLDCSDYVIRVPGNHHKSFATRAEAEQHYYANKALGNVQVVLP